MKNISWRHHYLPIFYLKGFTNENGKFLIFDKEQSKFIKGGKEFSPSSYFFEKNANTFIKNGEKDDFLETKFFAKLDDKIAKMYQLILASDSTDRFGITENDMPIMQHFVNLMYWRLPHRKNELKNYLEKEDLKGFGLFVKNENGTSDETTKQIEKRIKHDSEFKKSLGFLMSMLETVKMVHCRTPLTIQSFTKGLPKICSDNPVLFEKEYKPKVYEDDFIFPISGNFFLIRSSLTNNVSSPIFKLLVDTLIFKQTIKYASFTDENYFHSINEFYEKHFKSVTELRKEVFQYLKTPNCPN